MSEDTEISEQDLHAFIDNELTPERAAEVARKIDSDAVIAARVQAFMADKRQIADLYKEQLLQPLPASWLRRIEDEARGPRRVISRRTLTSGVFALAAALCIVFGYALLSQYFAAQEEPVITEALAASLGTTRPEKVFTAQTLPPQVERDRLLTQALDIPLKTPDLGGLGYELEEIRLYTGVPGGKAVELQYRNQQMDPFTLYVRHPSSLPRVDLFQLQGMRVCIWQDDVISTVMLGKISAALMARMASLAYTGLNL